MGERERRGCESVGGAVVGMQRLGEFQRMHKNVVCASDGCRVYLSFGLTRRGGHGERRWE